MTSEATKETVVVKQWAPLKINKTFINTMEEALLWPILIEKQEQTDGSYLSVEKRDPNSYNAIFLSEEDWVVKTNHMLKLAWLEEHQVSYTTFRRYKARLKAWQIEDSENIEEESLENFKYLWSVIKVQLQEQKQRLFQSMVNAPSAQRQKYARILERKYDSWNIRQKTEDVNVTKALTLAELSKKADALNSEPTNVPLESNNDA